MTNRYCIRLEDEVRLGDDSPKYRIYIYIEAPEGIGMDEFTANRVVSAYKKKQDAKFGVQEEETETLAERKK